MRTETINIYKFNELSDSAKENAISNWRNHGDYAWTDEWMDSLKTFCDLLGITIRDYSIGPYSHSYINWSYEPSYEFELTDIRGLRLRTWLINNWMPYFKKGKYYSGFDKWVDGKYHYKHRYSKCQFDYDNCPLTGYVGDMALIQPVLDFIAKPESHIDLEDIVNESNCYIEKDESGETRLL